MEEPGEGKPKGSMRNKLLYPSSSWLLRAPSGWSSSCNPQSRVWTCRDKKSTESTQVVRCMSARQGKERCQKEPRRAQRSQEWPPSNFFSSLMFSKIRSTNNAAGNYLWVSWGKRTPGIPRSPKEIWCQGAHGTRDPRNLASGSPGTWSWN